MQTLQLLHPEGRAPYLIADHLVEDLAGHVEHVAPRRRCFVITDSNVQPLYGLLVAQQLGAPLLALPAGEESKVWASVEKIIHFLLVNGGDRESVVVAVGGGVVTDVAGFAAAVALRGLAWVAVPTTLLGMVDAAIGGKTGINLDLGKNLVGCFWPPCLVAVDPLVLRTLPERELRAGLVEVVKAAIIAPSSLEHVVDRWLGAVAAGELAGAAELIAAAARVKADVVELDEREQGPRQVLNLGHTLGHALEAATDYRRFLHGEAVAWGLLAVLRLARDRGLFSTAEALAWAGRLEKLAPLPRIDDLSWEQIRPFVYRDKKQRQGVVDWVLPRLGGVVLGVHVAEEHVARVYEALCTLPPEGPFSGIF